MIATTRCFVLVLAPLHRVLYPLEHCFLLIIRPQMDEILHVQMELVMGERPPVDRVDHKEIYIVALHREGLAVLVGPPRPLGVECRQHGAGAVSEVVLVDEMHRNGGHVRVPAHVCLHDAQATIRVAHFLE